MHFLREIKPQISQTVFCHSKHEIFRFLKYLQRARPTITLKMPDISLPENLDDVSVAELLEALSPKPVHIIKIDSIPGRHFVLVNSEVFSSLKDYIQQAADANRHANEYLIAFANRFLEQENELTEEEQHIYESRAQKRTLLEGFELGLRAASKHILEDPTAIEAILEDLKFEDAQML